MNRREFMRGLALAFAGITLSELLTPVRMAEAAIAIYRGQSTNDRPSHGYLRSKSQESSAEENWPVYPVSIRETYLRFGPLENRLRTDRIVVHHTGVVSGAVTAASIHSFHKRLGWSGIGYHYVIDRNGIIERGRPRDTVGAHCIGFNKNTVGISLTGNYNTMSPAEVQLEALSELIAALCGIYRIRPGQGTIVGHRDLVSTACPGDNLYARLPEIRQRVIVKMGYSG